MVDSPVGRPSGRRRTFAVPTPWGTRANPGTSPRGADTKRGRDIPGPLLQRGHQPMLLLLVDHTGERDRQVVVEFSRVRAGRCGQVVAAVDQLVEGDVERPVVELAAIRRRDRVV